MQCCYSQHGTAPCWRVSTPPGGMLTRTCMTIGSSSLYVIFELSKGMICDGCWTLSIVFDGVVHGLSFNGFKTFSL